MENGKKFIFSVKADVCTANNKDVNATKLIEVMRTYGTVEDYDTHIKALRAEDAKTINNLVAQNEAIKSQNLSAEEVELVNLYRKLRATATKQYIDENEGLKKHIEEVTAESEKLVARIRAILPTETAK